MSSSFDVFVENIPINLDERRLREIFGVAGEIVGVKFIPPKANANTKSGFVKFKLKEDAECAAQYLSNYELKEEKTVLKVRLTKKSSDEPPISKTPLSRTNKIVLNETADVIVVHTEGPTTFFAQRCDQEDAITEMSNTLQTQCETQPKVTGQLSTQQIYGSKFKEDANWYRCKVEKCMSNNMVQVRYIDFGNTEVVTKTDLVTLPLNLTSKPAYALCFKLETLETITKDVESPLYAVGTSKLGELILDSLLKLKITGTESGVFVCKVETINDISAVSVDFVDQLLLTGTVKMKVAPSNPQQSAKQNPIIPQQRAPLPRTATTRVPILNNGMPNGNSHHQTNGHHPLNGHASPNKLEQDLQKYKEQVENLKQEIEKSKAEAGSINKRLTELFENVQSLRKLRRKLPCDDNIFPEDIEIIVDLFIVTADIIALSQIKQYTSIVDAQAVIAEQNNKIAESKEKSDDIVTCIEARETAMNTCIGEIKSFTKHIASLPLAQRQKSLEKALDDLNTEYGDIIAMHETKTATLLEAVNRYAESKSSRNEVLHNLQVDTNACSNKFYITMGDTVRQCHCVVTDVRAGVGDIDTQISDYERAIQWEVQAIQKLEEDEDTKNVLSEVVAQLQLSITNELNDISTIKTELLPQYETLKNRYQQLLSEKPDTSNVLKVRKKIKTLKSKYRHALADLHDIEEDSEENEATNLKELVEEASNIRNELHTFFVKEMKEMTKIANLLEDFPELNVTNPELKLKEFTASGGLLQPSRSVEHYSHEVLPVLNTQRKQTTYKSVFNNQPCVLKEIQLDAKTTYDEVINRINRFTACAKQSESFNKVDCIFKDKSGRRVYLQTTYYKDLQTFIEKKQPSQNTILLLLKYVLNILQGSETAYASLKPQNVLVKEVEGKPTVVLDVPNFSESEESRINSCMFTHRGMESYPVLDIFKEKPNKQADVLCFVALFIWATNPGSTFSHNIHADVEELVKDDSLREILRRGLSLTADERLTLKEIVQHPFFQNIKQEPKTPINEVPEKCDQITTKSEAETNLIESSATPVEENTPTEEGDDISDIEDVSADYVTQITKDIGGVRIEDDKKEDGLVEETHTVEISKNAGENNAENADDAAVDAWAQMLKRKTVKKPVAEEIKVDNEEF